jgi:hypothetical protein
MRAKILLYSLFLTASIAIYGCKKSAGPPSDDVKIKAGFMCGWGSGADSLEITRSTIRYVYYVPARSNLPVVKTSRGVSESEWNEIMNDLNLDEFTRLNYNTCNICVDGCDEWISIKDGELFHSIRFGKGTQIENISGLQNKLSMIRAEFAAKN